MQSKITEVRPKGTAQLKHGTFTKSEVFLANGNSYTFLSKGDFKKKVGDVIDYEVTNEEYGTARLVYNKDQQQNNNPKNADSIKHAVAFKGAIELAAAGVIKLDEVEQFTNQYYNFLK